MKNFFKCYTAEKLRRQWKALSQKWFGWWTHEIFQSRFPDDEIFVKKVWIIRDRNAKQIFKASPLLHSMGCSPPWTTRNRSIGFHVNLWFFGGYDSTPYVKKHHMQKPRSKISGWGLSCFWHLQGCPAECNSNGTWPCPRGTWSAISIAVASPQLKLGWLMMDFTLPTRIARWRIIRITESILKDIAINRRQPSRSTYQQSWWAINHS